MKGVFCRKFPYLATLFLIGRDLPTGSRKWFNNKENSQCACAVAVFLASATSVRTTEQATSCQPVTLCSVEFECDPIDFSDKEEKYLSLNKNGSLSSKVRSRKAKIRNAKRKHDRPVSLINRVHLLGAGKST